MAAASLAAKSSLVRCWAKPGKCDGVRIQCLLMVRDDFWLAVSRFMQALEERVAEGENARLVDLFDQRHARKVLAAFGATPGRCRKRAERRWALFSLKPWQAWPRTAKSSRCGWRCLPKCSRASLGLLRRCGKLAVRKGSVWRNSRRRFPRRRPRRNIACCRRRHKPFWAPCCRKPGRTSRAARFLTRNCSRHPVAIPHRGNSRTLWPCSSSNCVW